MPTHTSDNLEGRAHHESKVWYISDSGGTEVLASPSDEARNVIRATVGEVLILENKPQILTQTDLTHGLAAVVFADAGLMEAHRDRVPAGVKVFAVEK